MFEYVAERYHILSAMSPSASATNTRPLILPPSLRRGPRSAAARWSIHQAKQLARVTPVRLEVFAFGSLCIMSEGRCYLHLT
ncbi:U32 family peptidase [Shigella flexneri]